MNTTEKLFLLLTCSLYLFLAIFSYAYVDLNLTLSQNKFSLFLVSQLQQLAYFHRPQATFIYFVLICACFGTFVYSLYLFKTQKLTLRYLKYSLAITTLILIVSYPFLSYDIFNYMFDAKIILKYHANPYAHRPLDFPQDDWLRFMRWIHRYSPYGPLWLGFSLVPTLIGSGKFITTLFSFKIFISAFHLINALIIYKITKKLNSKLCIFSTALYALNPLFLIEGVANAHNDIIQATFLLLSIYFFIANKKILSFFSVASGFFIKYLTALLVPAFILKKYFKSINNEKFILIVFATSTLFTITFSSIKISVPFVSSGATQVQFQPWYLFWTIPLVALVPKTSLVFISIAVCAGAALRYLPFLYFGDWSHPHTIIFMQLVTIVPPLIICSIYALKLIYRKIQRI